MKVLLDENNYFTGSYAIVGDFDGSVDIDNIPEEKDGIKQLAYKYENDQWVFNETRYQELLSNAKAAAKAEEEKPTVESLQQQMNDVNEALAELLGSLE